MIGLANVLATSQELLHAAEQVDPVVHADACAEGDHRQGVDLETDADDGHHRVDQDRHQGQGDDHQDGADHRAEVQQAHHRHRGEHPAKDHEFFLAHFLVLRRHHAHVAGGEAVGDILGRVLLPILLHRGDHPLDGLGAVIGQEQHDRHHAAVAIEQAGAGFHVALRLYQLALVTRQVAPLQAALAPAGADDLGHAGQAHHVTHALDVLHVPREAVDGIDDAMVDAAVGPGLDDDVEDVGADLELGGDEFAVAVVARFRPELRYTRLGVTDRRFHALDEPEHAQHQRDHDDDRRRAALGDAGEAVPHALQQLLAVLDPLAVAVGDRHVGHQHRQQDQVRQDDDADAEACGDRHLLDDLHRDQQDGDEADQVGQERDDRRQEQQAEGASCSLVAAGAGHGRVTHRADLLNPVAGADGEDDEGHEDAQWIDTVAEQHQEPEHPHHRDQRRDHGHQRDAEGLDVDPHEQQGEQHGHHREGDDRHRAVGHVAHDLGEADHVHRYRHRDRDVDLAVLDLLADLLLQRPGDGDVVDRLPRLRVGIEQLRAHHGAGEVVGHQPADDAGLEDVLLDPRESLCIGLEVGGNDVAGLDAPLDHLGIARVRGPQRLNPRAVDAVDEEHLVGRDLECPEELRGEHVAVLGDDGDQQAVGAAEVRLVVEVGLDVLVVDRQLLGEVGVELEPAGGDPAEGDGQRRESRQDERAMLEDIRLEPLGNGGAAVGAFLLDMHGVTSIRGRPGVARRPPRPR